MSDIKHTARGFAYVEYTDLYGAGFSIQKSSLAGQDAIWFGIDDAKPQILASQAAAHGVETSERTGWVEYPVPEDVLLTTRMHLSRELVRELIPILQRFVDTGDL